MWKVAANTITLVAGIPGLPEARNKGFVRNYAPPPKKNKQTKPVNQRANDTKFPVRADINPGLWESSKKAMAPHSSTLAWNILWTEEPGRLQSMELLRVGQDWATSLSLFTFKISLYFTTWEGTQINAGMVMCFLDLRFFFSLNAYPPVWNAAMAALVAESFPPCIHTSIYPSFQHFVESVPSLRPCFGCWEILSKKDLVLIFELSQSSGGHR